MNRSGRGMKYGINWAICGFTFNRKKFHMGCTDRKLGSWRSPTARTLKLGPYGVCTGASDRGEPHFRTNFREKINKGITYYLCNIFF